MLARITVGQNTYNFSNIVETDVSFYDDPFWSRPGYADFKLKFAYDPIKKTTYPDDDIGRFSQWWHSLNKNATPRICVEFISGTQTIASGYVFNWEENREDFEVEFTCIDVITDLLDEQVTKSALTITSETITAVEQPPGPGNPPGNGDLPPIIPPGLPTHSYMPELKEFFWSAINEWWDSFRGDTPALTRPPSLPPIFPELSIMSIFASPINTKLQSVNSGTFRVLIKFKQLSNLERKEVLSDLSKFTQKKIVCSNGIHFLMGINPVAITGYIQSINPDKSTVQIDADRILESVILQVPGPFGWYNLVDYTTTIKNTRDNWLRDQIRPRTEYHIWGYNPNLASAVVLQSGYTIRLDGENFKIKEVSYESETMNSIKSFEAVCVKV